MPAAAAFWSNVFVDGELRFFQLGCAQLQSGQTPIDDSYAAHREVLRAVLKRLSVQAPLKRVTYQTRYEIKDMWIDPTCPLDAQPDLVTREGWDGMLTVEDRLVGGFGTEL